MNNEKTHEEWLDEVGQNGMSLRFVPAELMTSELCYTAIWQSGLPLKYVPDDFRTEDLCKLAVQFDGLCAERRSRHLQNRRNLQYRD